MNFDRLGFVAERAQVGEAKEAVFAVTIPEELGKHILEMPSASTPDKSEVGSVAETLSVASTLPAQEALLFTSPEETND